MFIVFETDNEEIVNSTKEVVETLDDLKIISLSDEAVSGYVPGDGYHIVSALSISEESTIQHAVNRHRWLSLAAKGVRVFSDTLSEDNPVYAGPVPTDVESLRRAIVDARLAEDRAKYFAGFGVTYVGRTKLDPRNMVVVDFDPENPDLSPLLATDLAVLYGSLTNDWWGSCGFVTSPSAEALEEFLIALPDTILLTYSNTVAAKLKFAGVDFARVAEPKGVDLSYGAKLREAANRLSYNLSLK